MVQQIQHTGNGPHPTRQSSAHIHQVTRIPNLAGYYCAVDLGIDALFVYYQDISGQLTLRYSVSLPAGEGPRHLAYTRSGNAYLVTELGNKIYPVHFLEDRGILEGPGVSTLQDVVVTNTAAALWVSPDDKSLWVSNRGEGTLTGFDLPGLQKRAVWTMFGMKPRDFCLVDNDLIVTACQDAGLTVIRNGKITDTVVYPGSVRVQILDRLE